VHNAAALVWDTLYGVDSQFVLQRQIVESESVSSDGLTWIFELREGLRFHDGLGQEAIGSEPLCRTAGYLLGGAGHAADQAAA
jgi:ABC-type transport system substrate-binding protein